MSGERTTPIWNTTGPRASPPKSRGDEEPETTASDEPSHNEVIELRITPEPEPVMSEQVPELATYRYAIATL